jgi:hypothetical protein
MIETFRGLQRKSRRRRSPGHSWVTVFLSTPIQAENCSIGSGRENSNVADRMRAQTVLKRFAADDQRRANVDRLRSIVRNLGARGTAPHGWVDSPRRAKRGQQVVQPPVASSATPSNESEGARSPQEQAASEQSGFTDRPGDEPMTPGVYQLRLLPSTVRLIVAGKLGASRLSAGEVPVHRQRARRSGRAPGAASTPAEELALAHRLLAATCAN